MSAATPELKVPPESVRTPVVGSPRRYPVCQAVDLTGRQTAARQARDQEIRALLETALKRLQEGP
jgi:hypothetical protein